MAIPGVSALDERINALKQQLATSKAESARFEADLTAKIARLEAVRAKITPEIVKMIVELNAALA